MDKKNIAGLLIDPERRTITEVEVTGDAGRNSHLASIYEHLQCRWIDIGRNYLSYLPGKPKDDIWFDEEGRESECPYVFQLPGIVPLVGKALILSYDDEGNSVSHTLTQKDIDALRASVIWSVRGC